MRTVLFFFTILLFSVSAWAQEVIVQGRVVDAETGEALPYVSIYVGNGRGTLSNSDGDFTIAVDANDSIRFSCVGYQTQRILASQLPKIIRMVPSVKQMNELTVLSVSAIMDRAQRQLKRSLRDGGARHGHYFCRIIEELGEGVEMIEAFVDAKSMVHIRDIEVLGGRQIRMDKTKQHPSLTSMNMHHLLEVGPMMKYNAFWNDLLVLPFNYKNYKKLYQCRYFTQKDDRGELIYVVRMLPDVRTEAGRMMEGTAYIDGRNHRLLRFTGTVPIMLMMYKEKSTGQTTHVNTHFTIDYRYNREGMAEVSNISFETKGVNIRARGLMFRIDDKVLVGKKGNRIEENMISTIRDAGFDSLMWANSYVVQRTRQEQLVVGGDYHDIPVDIKNPGLKAIYENLKRAEWTQGQEKVFVHMDNTSYQIGDTLWFSAYTQNTNNRKPSDISGVLYAELLNQDGSLVERKMLEMKDGFGQGFFALSGDKICSGFCELRAYTRWQLNWPDKLYSRVFPLYELSTTQHQEPSLPSHMKANRSLILTCYPEGGLLLLGVPNRVAFEAKWDDGEAADGVLILSGDSIPTEHQGRGAFVITPTEGKDYNATFCPAGGNPSVSTTLPQAQHKGANLQVSSNGTTYSIHSRISQDIEPGRMALSIQYNGILKEFIPFEDYMAEANFFRYQYKHTTTESGVYQATVFDDEGHVYADRLFFVRGTEDSEKLAIRGLQQTYEPFQQVKVTIQMNNADTRDKHHISVSVHDAENSPPTYDDSNIFTEMLLASEIKGFVPNAGWYFQSDDETHRRALDLLMMTQGWRRFNWAGLANDDSLHITQPREEQMMLMGHAVRTGGKAFKPNRFESKKMQGYHADMYKEAYIHAMLEDTSGRQKLPHMQTYDGGHFKLTIPKFYGSCVLHLGASNLDPYQLVSFKWDEKSDWEVFIEHPYPQFATDYTFYQSHLPHAVPTIDDNTFCPLRTYNSGSTQTSDDRRTILQGFTEPAQFYSPDYSKQKLPEGQKDYRRTLYWNPDLKLDEKGEATITFYNNCRTTHLSVEAEGQATDGTLLWGKTE